MLNTGKILVIEFRFPNEIKLCLAPILTPCCQDEWLLFIKGRDLKRYLHISVLKSKENTVGIIIVLALVLTQRYIKTVGIIQDMRWDWGIFSVAIFKSRKIRYKGAKIKSRLTDLEEVCPNLFLVSPPFFAKSEQVLSQNC